MKTAQKIGLLALMAGLSLGQALAQSPAISNWLVNSNGQRGRYYMSGNSTPIQDTVKVNVQLVRYNATDVYVNASGYPAYIVGPYLDNNPSKATNRKFVWRIPLSPQVNNGTKTNVGMGQIGVLLNGVPIYNYADGRSYNNAGVWNQNAVYFENLGFDCSKGHPSPVRVNNVLVGGTYHHHLNPTAYRFDVNATNPVCNLYTSDGMYMPDSSMHGPLIGYSFDGFPIYAGFGYANADGTGGIRRLRPSYRLRNITTRTNGPTLATYALGAYKEDYEFVAGSGDLDVHNGRFSVTPEYPNGIYCYFATVDTEYKGVYPYFIGPTYYGVVATDNFPAGPTSTNSNNVTVPATGLTTFVPTLVAETLKPNNWKLFPNPADEYAAVQIAGLLQQDAVVNIIAPDGRRMSTATLPKGSSLQVLDTRLLVDGIYVVQVVQGAAMSTQTLVVQH